MIKKASSALYTISTVSKNHKKVELLNYYDMNLGILRCRCFGIYVCFLILVLTAQYCHSQMELFYCLVPQNIVYGLIEVIKFTTKLILIPTASFKKLKTCYFLGDKLKTID